MLAGTKTKTRDFVYFCVESFKKGFSLCLAVGIYFPFKWDIKWDKKFWLLEVDLLWAAIFKGRRKKN